MGDSKIYDKIDPLAINREIPNLYHNYEKFNRLKYERPPNDSRSYYGLQKYDISKRGAYRSDDSPKVLRNQEVKLGDVKHHVFILKLYDESTKQYRSFCAGSIITDKRVLTSAQCFYTNRKRRRHDFNIIKMAAGLLQTVETYTGIEETNGQQWRTPTKVLTQKFYRFPAYSLAVAEIDDPWDFNEHVNKIPFAKSTFDYDGVCVAAVVKITKSWAYKKYLVTENHKIVPRDACEKMLLRTCRLYICTIAEAETATFGTAGGGLVCFETGSPEEDSSAGLLVGVTVLVHGGLPSLNHRIAMFHKWVTDETTNPQVMTFLMISCLCLIRFLR